MKNTFWMIKKIRQKRLVKKSKFVWRKKNPPEHKYSVTFVSKVGTISYLFDYMQLFPIAAKWAQYWSQQFYI